MVSDDESESTAGAANGAPGTATDTGKI